MSRGNDAVDRLAAKYRRSPTGPAEAVLPLARSAPGSGPRRASGAGEWANLAGGTSRRVGPVRLSVFLCATCGGYRPRPHTCVPVGEHGERGSCLRCGAEGTGALCEACGLAVRRWANETAEEQRRRRAANTSAAAGELAGDVSGSVCSPSASGFGGGA